MRFQVGHNVCLRRVTYQPLYQFPVGHKIKINKNILFERISIVAFKGRRQRYMQIYYEFRKNLMFEYRK